MRLHFTQVLTFFMLAVSALAEPERATLTLKGDKVFHHTHAGDEISYSINLIPGLHVVGYTKKTLSMGGKDLDVSELTLEGEGRVKIKLVESVPVVVLYDSEKKTWALTENK